MTPGAAYLTEARDPHGKWTVGAGEVTRAVKKIAEVGDTFKYGTREHYTDSNGRYTPERQTLHENIARDFLAGHLPQEDPQALFSAGGPASGKTALVDGTVPGRPKDAVDINPDLIKERLPEYEAMKAAGHAEIAAGAVHEESGHIAAQITKLALLGKHNVIIDGTGDSGPGKFASKINAARAHGHKVTVRYAALPYEEAVKREEARFKRTKRRVNPDYMRLAHAEVPRRYHNEVRHLPVKVEIYSTRGPKGQKPKLIAEKRPGDTHPRVKHQKHYREFVEAGA